MVEEELNIWRFLEFVEENRIEAATIDGIDVLEVNRLAEQSQKSVYLTT